MSENTGVTPEADEPPPPTPALPEPLLALMKTGWAEPAEHQLAPLPQAAHHAARRVALSAAFPGETLVIPTGGLATRSNDTDYEFRPGSDFAYLTGCYTEDAVLVMTPRVSGGHDSTIYLRPRMPRDDDAFFTSYHGDFWTGRRLTLAGYGTLYQTSCADLSNLEKNLSAVDTAATRVRRGIAESVDDMFEAIDDGSRDAELAQILAELRMVKDAWEIEQLTDAVTATIRGFEDIARALPADRESSERLVDGVFGLRARHDGNWVGYQNIVAAGEHACTLHWWRNNGTCRPGELLLLDAGVENVHFYTADITRTLPINGRFSPAQRRIYDVVYAAQEAGIAAVRPGARWLDVHHACMAVLAAGLAELGILPVAAEVALEKTDQRYRRWTLHSFGHMLGIDVHDCDAARKERYRDGELEAGMVLTVEPGLYFQPDDELVPAEFRGIGVRIEDNVVVTVNGCRNLSAALPRQADEVEAWLAVQRATAYQLPG